MSRFGRHTTAEEVARTADLRGRQVIITGGASGIGAETARALALTGAELLIGVRNVAAGEAVAREFEVHPSGSVCVLPLDLADLTSVAAFASRISGPVDVLIANAGVSKTPEAHLPNGLDVRFATNHLGHFFLALLLQPQMAQRGARIVVLSSGGHKTARVHLDDLQWKKRAHVDLMAYGESKTANILFAQEATRRWSAQRIFANAVLPGTVMTRLQRYHSDELKRRIGFILPDGTMNPYVKTVGQGAATSVWAAVAPELEGRGGLVLEDCAEAERVGPHTHAWSGFDEQVADPETARLLWERSLELVASSKQLVSG
jgi:NAD(P)-dependent dehydrogenase (short-subunit alcohol dehydrogenase family)